MKCAEIEETTDKGISHQIHRDEGAQDKWREAEELHNQVLEKTKRVVGSDNLDTMKGIVHLALNYQGQKE